MFQTDLKIFMTYYTPLELVLQVHDELLFEVPKSEIEILKNKVIKEMENACDPFLSLNVPLKVEYGVGENWNSAH